MSLLVIDVARRTRRMAIDRVLKVYADYFFIVLVAVMIFIVDV